MKASRAVIAILLILPFRLLSAQDTYVDIRKSAENDLYRRDRLIEDVESSLNRTWEDVSLSLLVKEVESAAEAAGLESFGLNISKNAINIIYRDIHFLPDSAELTPETTEKIFKLVETIQRFSEMGLLVQGHTAKLSSEDTDDGLGLSQERAESVARIISDSGIFKTDQIKAVGKGYYEPVAENTTPEGRALNRRVEISIVGSVTSESKAGMTWWNFLSKDMHPGYTVYLVHYDDLDTVKTAVESTGISDLIFAQTPEGIGILDNKITYREDDSPDAESFERMQKLCSLLSLVNHDVDARIGGYGLELPVAQIEERHFLTAYTLGALAGFNPENITYGDEAYSLGTATAALASGRITTADGQPVVIEGGGTSFNAVVPFSTNSLMIDITPADPEAVVTGLPSSEVFLIPGENEISVTLESSAETKKIERTYSLSVTRQNAELQSISISAGQQPGLITPAFSAEIKQYQIEVPVEIGDIDVEASILPEDEAAGASVGINKEYNEELAFGKNIIQVVFSDGFSEDAIYTIEVHRQAPAVTTLESVSVMTADGSNIELIPEFRPDISSYRAVVPYPVESVSIDLVPTDNEAVMETDHAEVQLSVGDNDLVTLITDQLGNSAVEYRLVIERSVPVLSALEITETDIDEEIALVPDYSPETTKYSVTVPYKTTSLQLNAALTDEDITAGASIEVISDNGEKLPVGTSKRVFRVTDASGKNYDYLVEIIREERTELTVDLFGLSLLHKWSANVSGSFYTGGAGFKLNGGMNVRLAEDSDVDAMLLPLQVGLGAHFHAGAGNYLTILSGGLYLCGEYTFPTERFLPPEWYFPKTIIPRLEAGFAYYGIDYTDGIYHEGPAFYLSPAARADFVLPFLPEMTFSLDLSYTAYISSIPITYLSLGINVGW